MYFCVHFAPLLAFLTIFLSHVFRRQEIYLVHCFLKQSTVHRLAKEQGKVAEPTNMQRNVLEVVVTKTENSPVQGCTHQGDFGGSAPPDFETYTCTMLVGVATKTPSIFSSPPLF